MADLAAVTSSASPTPSPASSSPSPATAPSTTTSNPVVAKEEIVPTNNEPSSPSAMNFLDDPPVNLNLFVNYLPQEVNDEALRTMFVQFGDIESCKVMIDLATGQSRCFGFVKFKNAKQAQAAVQSLNGYKYGSKTLVVKYANATNTTALGTPSSNVYVKGIPLVMSNEQLHSLFGPYGNIADCKILLDPQTQLSRGMGFIRYNNQQEAENAINALNGQVLPGTVKPIIVKFADTDEERLQRRVKQQKKRTQTSRYNPYPAAAPEPPMRGGGGGGGGYGGGGGGGGYVHTATHYPAHTQYQAAPTYMAPQMTGQPMSHMGGAGGQDANLFVYHLPSDADDALLYRLFSPYGAIESVKVIRDHSTGACKGYGFVKMMSVNDAWNAIHGLSNYKIGEKYLQVTFKRGQ